MKRTIIAAILAIAFITFGNNTNAQIQKGDMMFGSNITNLRLGLGSDANTSFTLNPKVGYFVMDRLVVGVDLLLGIDKVSGVDGVGINYGAGAFGRYYISDSNIEPFKRWKWFLEGTAAFKGFNHTEGGNSTNGLGLGFGPGVAYFITPNIGLEALVKYDGIIGFGSASNKNNLLFSVGFQVYLPTKSTRAQLRNDFSR